MPKKRNKSLRFFPQGYPTKKRKSKNGVFEKNKKKGYLRHFQDSYIILLYFKL